MFHMGIINIFFLENIADLWNTYKTDINNKHRIFHFHHKYILDQTKSKLFNRLFSGRNGCVFFDYGINS